MPSFHDFQYVRLYRTSQVRGQARFSPVSAPSAHHYPPRTIDDEQSDLSLATFQPLPTACDDFRLHDYRMETGEPRGEEQHHAGFNRPRGRVFFFGAGLDLECAERTGGVLSIAARRIRLMRV
jgi:hypothetical protein